MARHIGRAEIVDEVEAALEQPPVAQPEKALRLLVPSREPEDVAHGPRLVGEH